MSKRPSDQQFMNFLYEELSSKEMNKVASYLKEHPEVNQEIAELKQTREVLTHLEDEEVIEPSFHEFSTAKDFKGRMPASVWVITSIAASIILIMVMGYLTQIQFSYSDQGLKLGFGQTETPSLENLTEADVQKILSVRLDEERQIWNENLTSLESNLGEQLAQNKSVQQSQINRLAKADKVISDDQISSFVDQLKNENRVQLASFYEATALEQEAYMKEVLNEFFKYLSDRREEDLKLIQANMLEIKSTTDERQQETDKILASIITTVYNQNSVGR